MGWHLRSRHLESLLLILCFLVDVGDPGSHSSLSLPNSSVLLWLPLGVGVEATLAVETDLTQDQDLVWQRRSLARWRERRGCTCKGVFPAARGCWSPVCFHSAERGPGRGRASLQLSRVGSSVWRGHGWTWAKGEAKLSENTKCLQSRSLEINVESPLIAAPHPMD